MNLIKFNLLYIVLTKYTELFSHASRLNLKRISSVNILVEWTWYYQVDWLNNFYSVK